MKNTYFFNKLSHTPTLPSNHSVPFSDFKITPIIYHETNSRFINRNLSLPQVWRMGRKNLHHLFILVVALVYYQSTNKSSMVRKNSLKRVSLTTAKFGTTEKCQSIIDLDRVVFNNHQFDFKIEMMNAYARVCLPTLWIGVENKCLICLI